MATSLCDGLSRIGGRGWAGLTGSLRNLHRQARTRTGGPGAEAVLPRESGATTCQGTVPGLAAGPSLANQRPFRWVIGTDWPPQRRVTDGRLDSSVTVAPTRVVVAHGATVIWGGEAVRSLISGGCSTRRATATVRAAPPQVSSTRASASPSGRPSRVAVRLSLACSPPSRRPLEGPARSHGVEGSAAQDSGSSPPLRTVTVALVPADPRSTLAGETASEAGAAGVVVLVVVAEVEVLVEVEGAVVGVEAGAVEVAAPATTGPPPWPSDGLDSAGDRSHPSPTPTPTLNSIAATSAATAMRRRPLPAPPSSSAGRPVPAPGGGLSIAVSWNCSRTRPRRSGGAGMGGTAARRARGLASLRRAAPQVSQLSTWRATRLRTRGENRPSQSVSRRDRSGQSARPRRATRRAPRERSTWSRRRVRST